MLYFSFKTYKGKNRQSLSFLDPEKIRFSKVEFQMVRNAQETISYCPEAHPKSEMKKLFGN